MERKCLSPGCLQDPVLYCALNRFPDLLLSLRAPRDGTPRYLEHEAASHLSERIAVPGPIHALYWSQRKKKKKGVFTDPLHLSMDQWCLPFFFFFLIPGWFPGTGVWFRDVAYFSPCPVVWARCLRSHFDTMDRHRRCCCCC